MVINSLFRIIQSNEEGSKNSTTDQLIPSSIDPILATTLLPKMSVVDLSSPDQNLRPKRCFVAYVATEAAMETGLVKLQKNATLCNGKRIRCRSATEIATTASQCNAATFKKQIW
ncbi:hypothetical protein DM860_017464 [Cuscuta australis]|uniref:Uncharacterized protein n=1 Tax=Cuscuta australis TaxID=267555 RepID=A0A328E0M1_9ASTE|nr:hypothetical protein DM860_017464 [Cuscuta australis]